MLMIQRGNSGIVKGDRDCQNITEKKEYYQSLVCECCWGKGRIRVCSYFWLKCLLGYKSMWLTAVRHYTKETGLQNKAVI